MMTTLKTSVMKLETEWKSPIALYAFMLALTNRSLFFSNLSNSFSPFPKAFVTRMPVTLLSIEALMPAVVTLRSEKASRIFLRKYIATISSIGTQTNMMSVSHTLIVQR